MSTDPPPPSPRKPSFVATGLLVASVVGLWLLVWAEVFVGIPRAKRALDEFGLQLPDVTRAVIHLGAWASSNAIFVLPFVLTGAVLFGVLIGLFRHRPKWSFAATVLAFLLLFGLALANVVVVGAMLLPALKLQQGLAK